MPWARPDECDVADTEQEANGLLTADRQPKIPASRLHGVITRPSRAMGAEQVDAERTDAHGGHADRGDRGERVGFSSPLAAHVDDREPVTR